MDSSGRVGTASTSGRRHESPLQSRPVNTVHNKENLDQSLHCPTIENFRDPQLGPSSKTETGSIRPNVSPMNSTSSDPPFASLSSFHQKPPSQQAPYAPSSDYGDNFEYDELFELSNLPGETSTHNLPIVLDLTDSPCAEATKSRKRQAEYTEDDKSSKVTRKTGPQDKNLAPPKLCENEIDIVDLRDVETPSQWKEKIVKETSDPIKAHDHKQADQIIKLSSFQCIICMDNPTDLTITHCGHMFCSECLNQALLAGDKKCCPICRTPINLPKAGGRPVKNGIFRLEIKLRTTTKKGKQASGES